MAGSRATCQQITSQPGMARLSRPDNAYPKAPAITVPMRNRSPTDKPPPPSRSANTTTMPAPAALASQKPRLGLSRVTIAAAAAVASGTMPSTTPPCAAGTCAIASAINTGKPTIVHRPAMTRCGHSLRAGRGRRSASSTATPQQPAMLARTAVRSSGSKRVTASRVAGSVPPNSSTPAMPRARPSFSRECVIAGRRD